MNITVSAYDDSWPSAFILIKNLLESSFSSPYLCIEHVGSTSVPGLAAKPVIDIDILVEQTEDMSSLIIDLKELGYKHLGDLGITGREAFRAEGSLSELPRHNLYLIEKNNIAWINHKSLRDYLITNAEARDKYAQLKLELAEKYPDNIDAYIDGKTDFILNILSLMDMNSEDLSSIKDQNKLT